MAQNATEALISTVVQIADDHLILGHRMSEWCGHAPMLEEDLSMPNMALDVIGQSRALYATLQHLKTQAVQKTTLPIFELIVNTPTACW